jgi:hypothetical protein
MKKKSKEEEEKGDFDQFTRKKREANNKPHLGLALLRTTLQLYDSATQSRTENEEEEEEEEGHSDGRKKKREREKDEEEE